MNVAASKPLAEAPAASHGPPQARIDQMAARGSAAAKIEVPKNKLSHSL